MRNGPSRRLTLAVGAIATIISLAVCAAYIARTHGPHNSQESFYGDWYHHGEQLHLDASGTGSIKIHVGSAAVEWVNEVELLTLSLSPDGSTLTARITDISYETYDSANRTIKVDDPEPEGVKFNDVGDVFYLHFEKPHLIKGVADPRNRNRDSSVGPYICGPGVANDVQGLCGQ
jgi:hypothetical protein